MRLATPTHTYTPPQRAVAPESSITKERLLAMRLLSSKPATLDQSTTEIVVTKVIETKHIAILNKWHASKKVVFASEGAVVALHRDLQFAFSLTPIDLRSLDRATTELASPNAMRVVLKNSSPTGAQIDWNAVNIIGPDKRSHGVIRKGIRYTDAAAPMAPSVVPPGAMLDDFLFPKDHISYISGRYGGWSGQQFFEQLKPGDRVILYLPVKHGQDLVEYQFEFEASAPKP